MSASWEMLPLSLDPIALSIGFFSLSWYSLFFIFGGVAALSLLRWQLVRVNQVVTKEEFWSLSLWLLWGVVVGARIGFILGYDDFFRYLAEPWRIISPYDFEREMWTGIRGMSFFGGLVGGLLGLHFFSRKRKISYMQITDACALASPIALFFGRLGNFVGGELIGRVTSVPWAMRFPSDPTLLRHPSPLYEAVGEGLFLLLLLYLLYRAKVRVGVVSASFLIGYGVIRFTLEFFREPDVGGTFSWGSLGLNQGLSLLLVLLGTGLLLGRSRLWYTKDVSKENTL